MPSDQLSPFRPKLCLYLGSQKQPEKVREGQVIPGHRTPQTAQTLHPITAKSPLN